MRASIATKARNATSRRIPYDLPWSDNCWLDLTVTFLSGDVEDYTDQASFSSENTAIASQYNSETTAAAIGDTFIDGFVSVEGSDKISCSGLEGCDFEDLEGFAEPEVVPRILMGLNGNAPAQDITGSTQGVITGQQVQLAASYELNGGSDDSGSWNVSGTTASGWTPGQQPSPISTSGTSTTVYWTAPGSNLPAAFNLAYTDAGGNQQNSSASTTFNANGPTNVSVSTCGGTGCPGGAARIGTWNITGAGLQLGGGTNSGGNVGIAFVASGTAPAGATNNFVWGQTLNTYAATLTVSGNRLACQVLGVPGLDNAWPYPGVHLPAPDSNDPVDGPALGLVPDASEEILNFGATMYLVWQPGLGGDIQVPLGSVTWTAHGDATQISGTWSVQGGSTAAAEEYVPASNYPTWAATFTNGNLFCGSQSVGAEGAQSGASPEATRAKQARRASGGKR